MAEGAASEAVTGESAATDEESVEALVIPTPTTGLEGRVAEPEEIPTAPAPTPQAQEGEIGLGVELSAIQILLIVVGLLFIGLLVATFYARRYVP